MITYFFLESKMSRTNDPANIKNLRFGDAPIKCNSTEACYSCRKKKAAGRKKSSRRRSTRSRK